MNLPPAAHLYESLAGEIAHMISAGVIKSGERLPSIRKLSSQRDVSLSTVIQAFRVLEDRGLIEVRPQAGFFVRRQALRALPRTSQPSPWACASAPFGSSSRASAGVTVSETTIEARIEVM